jgi:hypothetical protein
VRTGKGGGIATWNTAILVGDEKLALRAHSFLMGSATRPYSSLATFHNTIDFPSSVQASKRGR